MISGTNVPLQLQCTKLVCHKPQLKPKHTSHADHAIKQIYYQGMRTGDDFCNKCSFTPSNLEEKKCVFRFFRKIGSVSQFLMLSDRLFHIAGAYDLKALPPKDYRITEYSLQKTTASVVLSGLAFHGFFSLIPT